MRSIVNIDFLIIGQGLAGSLLAWELIRSGCSVLVLDHGTENASQVAAGLINPITGMRLVKSTEVDELLPVAKQCYAQLAQCFGQVFYHERMMLRLLSQPADERQALKRLSDPAYQPYLGKLYHEQPHTFLEQKQTGYLLTRNLLSCMRDYFSARNSYHKADFNCAELLFKPILRWQHIAPARIIFCDGHYASQSPWFSWLPFQLAKGEILTMEHLSPIPQTLLNYGNWLIPTGQQQFRIGATFDTQTINTHPSQAAKHTLINALTQVKPEFAQARCLSHQANIRPCTRDKQPFLGFHPRFQQLAIFNGFGAKGSLQIPWYSQQFANALRHNTPIPADIQRYYATHFPS
ncbi:MAG: FAD-binding oxidoreductase [Methylovulum sp.]|nr:FAD-binding oxidoreductase [Methylovulum sp.]MCF8000035.1 FAD-binding oxidoreductase [Methylovulum sp.]